MARKREVSEIDGYGLKIANIPSNMVSTKRGCRRTRIVKPPTYDERWSQKTPRKNALKESNISIKKYHHKPTFGVRSGSNSCTPYVDDINSQEPVIIEDMYNREDIDPAADMTFLKTKPKRDWSPLFGRRRSKHKRINGGRRRIGYIER